MTDIVPRRFELTASNWASEHRRPNDPPPLTRPGRKELEKMLAQAARNTAKMCKKIKD